MKINATYQSNYNGCSLSTDDEQETEALEDKFEKCSEAICDILYDDCDEDGYFQGSDQGACRVMTKQVKKFFGEDTEVVCNVDEVSS